MFDKVSRVISILFGAGAIICLVGCCSVNDAVEGWVTVIVRCLLLAVLCIALSALFYDWAETKAKATAFVIVILAALYPKTHRLRQAGRASAQYRRRFKNNDELFENAVERSLQYDEQRRQVKVVRQLNRGHRYQRYYR